MRQCSIIVFLFRPMIKYLDRLALWMFKNHIEHRSIRNPTGMSQDINLKIICIDKPNKVVIIGSFKIPKGFDVLKEAFGLFKFHGLIICI